VPCWSILERSGALWYTEPAIAFIHPLVGSTASSEAVFFAGNITTWQVQLFLRTKTHGDWHKWLTRWNKPTNTGLMPSRANSPQSCW